MYFNVFEYHPHSLGLEPWDMCKFYTKQRNTAAPGRPPPIAQWVLREDVAEWLRNFHGLLDSDKVFPPVVYKWDLYTGYQLRFRSQQDLIMFKLTWVGAL